MIWDLLNWFMLPYIPLSWSLYWIISLTGHLADALLEPLISLDQRKLLAVPVVIIELGLIKYNYLARVKHPEHFRELGIWSFFDRHNLAELSLGIHFIAVLVIANWIIDALSSSAETSLFPFYVSLIVIMAVAYRNDRGMFQAFLKCKDCVVYNLRCLKCEAKK